MKRKFILFTASLGIAYVTFSSYAMGPGFAGQNRTGAPGTTGNCAGSGCHSGNSSATVMTLSMVDKGGSTPVTEYVPGATYTITVGGTNSSNLPKFGFQVCAERKSDNTNAGTLVKTSSVTDIRTLSGIKLIEHNTAIDGVSAGVYAVQFDWTAPAAGTGDVVFYGILNAVNNSGNSSGDMPGNPIAVTVKESTGSSVKEQSGLQISKLYPNPANELLQLEIGNAVSGKYSISITDMNGKTVQHMEQVAQSATMTAQLNIAGLASGHYFVKVSNGQGQQAVPFVKK